MLVFAANVIFGVLMFGVYSAFEDLNLQDARTMENLEVFGKWCWALSGAIFAGSHLRMKPLSKTQNQGVEK